jgi:hypothetical protein
MATSSFSRARADGAGDVDVGGVATIEQAIFRSSIRRAFYWRASSMACWPSTKLMPSFSSGAASQFHQVDADRPLSMPSFIRTF